jgi:hypothetical protein
LQGLSHDAPGGLVIYGADLEKPPLSDSEFRSSPFLDRVEDLLAELLLAAWELVFATLRRASGTPRKAFSDALTRRSIG